jgi:hypothetical protein
MSHQVIIAISGNIMGYRFHSCQRVYSWTFFNCKQNSNKTINEVSWTDFVREKITKIIAKSATISLQSQVQHFYNAAHMPRLTSRTISENIYFKSISYLYRMLFMYLCKQLHN